MSKRNIGGAMPPPDKSWEIGKTAATIKFVQDATAYIENCEDEQEIEILKNAIELAKSRQLVFDKWTTPEEYLSGKK